MDHPNASPHNDLQLPLRSSTPRSWAELAARDLDCFLADHAVCEHQAAVSAMALMGKYPDDLELVERMATLASEELLHLRRVLSLMRQRDVPALPRRANAWVQALRARIDSRHEPLLKIDRLLVSALIEARSCERFTRLGEVLGVRDASGDQQIKQLLDDLGPAEARHWRLFHQLAARDAQAPELDARWQRWLEIEAEISADFGRAPYVHG